MTSDAREAIRLGHMVELAQSQVAEAAAATPEAPRIWALVSEKPGDMAQVQAILDALALPWEPKRLVVDQRWQIANPPFRPDLDHLDRARSDRLEPPWPDLVIASGRRMAGPQLWIKQQSGGRTKLVLVGRPRRWLDRFDLVIGTSQYRLPPKPNVLRLDLPLMRPAIEAVAKAREEWAPKLASLPRPLIAVLVGGQTKPFRFDAEVARELMRRSQALAAAEGGGTLYVTTSRRTPKPVAEALARRTASAQPGRGAVCAPGECPPLSLASRQRRREPVFRSVGACRPVHRHRRQRLDDGRGRAARSAAAHL